MSLVYVTLEKDGKFLAYRNPPAGKTALIVNVASDLTGETKVITAHDLESLAVFASLNAAEVIDWSSPLVAVNIHTLDLVD